MPAEMVMTQITPGWIIASIAGSLLTGLIVFGTGRKLPRRGDWLVTLGLLGLLVPTVMALLPFFDQPSAVIEWRRGWIWPRDEEGAVNVGVLLDGFGLMMTLLGVIISSVLVFSGRLLSEDQRQHRFYAAAVIGACGSALAWVSLTPWLAAVGIAIASLGGFAALNLSRDSEDDAATASRYGRERAWGLILMTLGAAALASSGVKLEFQAGPEWAGEASNWIGSLLLLLGLFIHLQPFPLLGWSVMPSGSMPSARMVMAQVFPAWAAFAVLLRLETYFRAAGVFPVLGWMAVVSAVLATATGLFQTVAQLSSGLWFSAAMSLALAALAFAGPQAGAALAIAAGVAAAAMSLSASMTTAGESRASKNPKLNSWILVGSIASALAATGGLGFISFGGSVHWLMSVSDDPLMLAAFAAAEFLLFFLVWRSAWTIIRMRPIQQATVWSFLSPLVLVLLCLGVIWNGALTGATLPGAADRVLPSLLQGFFGEARSKDLPSQDDALILAIWIHLGAVALAFIAAYWTTARKQDSFQQLRRSFPRLSGFFAEGYRLDRVVSRGLDGAAWLGDSLERWFGKKTWGQWIPVALSTGLQRMSTSVTWVDVRVTRTLDRSLRESVEVPSKLLQMIQSGNVQWYLLFAVGSGIAILLHFLRF